MTRPWSTLGVRWVRSVILVPQRRGRAGSTKWWGAAVRALSTRWQAETSPLIALVSRGEGSPPAPPRLYGVWGCRGPPVRGAVCLGGDVSPEPGCPCLSPAPVLSHGCLCGTGWGQCLLPSLVPKTQHSPELEPFLFSFLRLPSAAPKRANDNSGGRQHLITVN